MTESTPADEPSPVAAPDKQNPIRRPIVPLWLVITLVILAIIVFVVRQVDYGVATAIAVLSVMFAGCVVASRTLRSVFGFGALTTPIVLLAGLICFFSVVRVDEFSGNVFPTKLSWRWQKKADELMEMPKVASSNSDSGIDLLSTTRNDSPQFLGTDRDAKIRGIELETDWETNPPKQIWRKPIGAGWAAFAAVNGYAVTLEQRGPLELTTCYEIETGEVVWVYQVESRHESLMGGVGPRSTPTIYEGKVYTVGATGMVTCLDGSNGELIWQHDLVKESGSTQEDEVAELFWGRASSPWVGDGRVIVPMGGTAESPISLVVYDATTGDEIWRAG